MNIQAMIFNWRGQEANAARLEMQLSPLAPTVVINSDEEAIARHPHWVHLNEEAYFSAQWNAALQLFQADVLFHVQADASIGDCATLFSRATYCFGKYSLGVYEPNIDFTDFTYDTAKLPSLGPDRYQVPMTDSTCWFIHGSLVREFQPIDVSINRYGWGVAGVIAAFGRIQGKISVRDYGVKVHHPKRRGYATRDAMSHRRHYFQSLPPIIQRHLQGVYRDWELTRPAAPLPLSTPPSNAPLK